MENKLNHPIVAHVYCDDGEVGGLGFLCFWFRTSEPPGKLSSAQEIH